MTIYVKQTQNKWCVIANGIVQRQSQTKAHAEALANTLRRDYQNHGEAVLKQGK